MDSVDRILDVIDAGLQTPAPDPSFGEVSPVNREECWHCQRNAPAEDSDSGVCADCRAFLLGETDDDPRSKVDVAVSSIDSAGSGPYIHVTVAVFDEFSAAFQRMQVELGDHLHQLDRHGRREGDPRRTG